MNNYNFLDCKKVNEQVLEATHAEQEGRQISDVRGTAVALVKNISSGKTSTGKPKYNGILANVDESKFNVWSNSSAFKTLSECEIVPGETFVNIEYTISKFGLVIERLDIIEDPLLNKDDFIYHKYTVREKSKEYVDALTQSGATQNASEVISAVLGMGTNNVMYTRFPLEYAALSNHDNCETGLLAHTVKCLKIYNGIRGIYGNIFNDSRINDLMIIGLIIHDCGKVFEMYNGTYQRFSYVTHRGLGVEYLLQYKDFIIEKYDEDFFYMLFSILQQHHDEYGEGAKTIYAYIAHIIDNVDATLSSIDEMIENQDYISDDSGKKIKLNDRYFNIL